jgi:hypothetical protein
MGIVDGVSSAVSLLDQRLTLSIDKKLDLVLQEIEVKEKQAGLEHELRQLQRPRKEVPPPTPPHDLRQLQCPRKGLPPPTPPGPSFTITMPQAKSK